MVLVGWLGLSTLGLKGDKLKMGLEFKAIQDKISKLKDENKVLQEFKAYFTSDRFLAKEAREKLNYKDPNEKVVFVYPKTASESPKEISKKEPQSALENYRNWLYYVLNLKRD